MISHISRFTNLENNKFFTVPTPFEDEILSSWLIRIAIAHDTQPRTFMNIHFPETKPNFWSHDVDIFWGNKLDFLKKLSFKSNIPTQQIYQMSLLSYEGFLSETVRDNGHNKLLTRIKNRGRSNQLYGVRFCPHCLASDAKPYFRKSWRLSFITTCQEHECFLEDSCPKCKSPITPYILHNKNDFCKCHSCHYPLYKIKTKELPLGSYGLTAQQNLSVILSKGFFSFQKNTYISLAYFPVLNQVAKLIYNSSLHKNTFNHEITYTPNAIPTFTKKPSIYVEDIPITEQYLIYSASEYILTSIRRMKLFCKSNSLGKGLLTHSMGYIPFWFAYIVHDNDISFYSVSIEEVKSLILFLHKRNIPLSFKTLSLYLDRTVERRKRPDIKELLLLNERSGMPL